MKSKVGQVFIHVLGCIMFLSLPVIFSPDFSSSMYFIKVPFFQMDFMNYVSLIAFFYFTYYFLIPKFYFRGRYYLFSLGLIISFGLLILIPHLVPVEFPNPPRENQPLNPHFSLSMQKLILMEVRHHLFQFLTVLIFSLMLKIYSRWKQTEKEKANAELAYLKAQINPHFLFNVLNGIYSLALEKSDITASAIVKLSGLMRYVINEANKDLVPLEREIAYITDYIELQKIRLGNTVMIKYSVAVNTFGQQIAPLLLIPFIENAFKHGVNAEDNSLIEIRINTRNDELLLEVHNNKVEVKNSGDIKSGLGIDNTKNRLQLLYPGKHKLQLLDSEKEFSVILSLTLK